MDYLSFESYDSPYDTSLYSPPESDDPLAPKPKQGEARNRKGRMGSDSFEMARLDTDRHTLTFESDSDPSISIEGYDDDEDVCVEADDKNKRKSDEPGQRDWKQIGFWVAVTGAAILLVGVGLFAAAMTPVAPLAFAIAAFIVYSVGATTIAGGVSLMCSETDMQQQLAKNFTLRFSGESKSYHQVLNGFTTDKGQQVPPLGDFDKFLARINRQPKDLLLNLNNNYKKLKHLEVKPDKIKFLTEPPEGWGVDLQDGKKYDERKSDIEGFTLSSTQKAELRANGVDVKAYKTYWKNFLILKAAAHQQMTWEFFTNN